MNNANRFILCKINVFYSNFSISIKPHFGLVSMDLLVTRISVSDAFALLPPGNKDKGSVNDTFKISELNFGGTVK